MSNSLTSQGQLQRAGIQRLVAGKKRRKKLVASRRIKESMPHLHSFAEQGQDDKQNDKSKKKGRVYLVTIIEEGLGNSKDKNYYSGDALQHGTQVFNGSKAYSDHPDAIQEKTLPERSMKDLVGWYSDCFVDKNPQTGKIRLRGKLHFFPDAKWLTDKIDTILTDPSAKNLFGISINAIGKTRPATMEGEQVNYVEEFQRVDSADVVTEPAARGKFDQMLESRRLGRSHHIFLGGKVSKSMKRRARESGVLSPEKAKGVADSLVSAYNSDSPDELRTAAFEAAKVLHASSSISGKGPGQVNEEQYSNINPSGGADPMKKVKASAGKRSFRKGKRLQAAAGTGPDNEDEGEPGPEDIESRIEESDESDVEDEEGRGDLGSQGDFGGGSSYRSVKTSKRRNGNGRGVAVVEEDEGFEDEDEDEGYEDEDEDEAVGMAPGGAPSVGPGGAAPTGGGMPGSSRGMTSEADDEGYDDDTYDDDDEEMDESIEDEAFEASEDEDEDEHDMMRPGSVAESRRARASGRRSAGRRRSQEASDRGSGQGQTISDASYSGGLGHSGHTSLPKGGDPTHGYEDTDEDYGKKDDSTSGVGKSYKIKTSRFARNRASRRIVKPVVREANRRIEFLTNEVVRLRESLRGKERKVTRLRGKIHFMESGRTATVLLREAVKEELIPRGVARELLPQLMGLSREEQIREIRRTSTFLESAMEGTVARLTESVDGNGARGGFVSRGTSDADNPELVTALEIDGVPMKRSNNR